MSLSESNSVMKCVEQIMEDAPNLEFGCYYLRLHRPIAHKLPLWLSW